MSDTFYKGEIDLDELAEIVQEMLDGVLDASLEGILPTPYGPKQDVTVEATVHILGDANAVLTLRLPGPVAFALTGALVGEDPGGLEGDDVSGTVAELTNVVGGSVKTMLAEETFLGVPSSRVIANADLVPLASAVDVFHDVGLVQAHLELITPEESGSDDGPESLVQ